jgi:hypothetical protein
VGGGPSPRGAGKRDRRAGLSNRREPGAREMPPGAWWLVMLSDRLFAGSLADLFFLPRIASLPRFRRFAAAFSRPIGQVPSSRIETLLRD